MSIAKFTIIILMSVFLCVLLLLWVLISIRNDNDNDWTGY